MSNATDLLRLIQADELLHEVLASCLGLSALICYLLTLYLVRSERLRQEDWWPTWPPSLGWSLAGFFFWIGGLLFVLGLLVLFGSGPVPGYGIVLILAIIASLMAVLRAFAEEEA